LLVLGIGLRIILGDFSADPDYSYLLNGLNVLQLQSPGQSDHPGTTVHLLAGAVIGIVWLARAIVGLSSSPLDDTLLHPELYLQCVRLVLTGSSAVALFVLGWRIYRTTASLAVAAIAQLSLFSSSPALAVGMTHVAPEGLFVPLTLLMSAALVSEAFGRGSPVQGWRHAMALGAILGACLATKTNSAPLVLCLLVFRDRSFRLRALVATALFALCFTLPVARNYQLIIEYNWNLLSRAGAHGSGELFALSLSDSWRAIRGLLSTAPEMFVSTALCAIMVVVERVGLLRIGDLPLSRLFLACGAIMLVQLALVAKHPQPYYLIPSVAIMCLANGGIAYALLHATGWSRIAGGAALGGLIVAAFWHGGRDAVAQIDSLAVQERDNRALHQTAARSGCKLVFAYEARNVEYRLFFGILFSNRGRIFNLFKLYPDLVIYSEPERLMLMAGRLWSAAEIDRWVGEQDCVYLVSSPIERFAPGQVGISPSNLVLIDRTAHGDGSIAIYRIRPPAEGGTIFTGPPPR
jgi:hypothetical protein